jgi:hypothetical protein
MKGGKWWGQLISFQTRPAGIATPVIDCDAHDDVEILFIDHCIRALVMVLLGSGQCS